MLPDLMSGFLFKVKKIREKYQGEPSQETVVFISISRGNMI